jgi:hypothetical protein
MVRAEGQQKAAMSNGMSPSASAVSVVIAHTVVPEEALDDLRV